MERIKLADGRELEVITFAVSSNGSMFVRVAMTLGEAAAVFANNTDTITYMPSEGNHKILRGWSKLAYIVNEEGCVRVALERPFDIEEVING